jgi:hypothetical protein
MASTITLAGYGYDAGKIIFTLKGTPKDLPKGIKSEAGDKKGTTKVVLAQDDFVHLNELGAVLKANGGVDVEEGAIADHYNWFKTNFVPVANGGGKAEEDGAAGEEASASDEGGAEAEEAATVSDNDNNETEDKVKPAKTTNTKKAPPAKAKAARATRATAKAAPATKAKAIAKPKMPPPTTPAKAKAAAPAKERKPRQAKAEPESAIDAGALKAAEKAIVELAKAAPNIRTAKVVLTRMARRLADGRGGIKLLAENPDIVTAGVIPGQTYTVQKNHARAGWGKCEYTIEILADSRIKLVSFKGEKHGRDLKSGQVYATSKDLLKEVLKLNDPHVTLAKFFNI